MKTTGCGQQCSFWGASFFFVEIFVWGSPVGIFGCDVDFVANVNLLGADFLVDLLPKGPFRTKNSTAPESVVFCYRRSFSLSVPFCCLFFLKNKHF